MTIDEITKELETAQILPGKAADLSVIVAAKYGRACDQYVAASSVFAKKFNETREEYKSDTACERAIENSDLGVEEKYWKYQVKKCEMLQKALSNLIYVKTSEARNET